MYRWISFLMVVGLVLGSVPLRFEGADVAGATSTTIANATGTSSENATASVSPDRFIVFFDEAVDVAAIELLGGKVIQEFPMIQAATIEISPSLVPALEQLPFFQKIVTENKVEAQAQPVQITPWQHGQRYLNLPAKQPSTLTGKGVKVAVIDSGVDMDHPDLRIKGGKCVLDLSLDPKACSKSYDDEDVDGHGTHVAGIIGALNNGIGTVGVAPGADIYALKALDKTGFGSSTTIMAGIEWAITNKMDIINLSISSPEIDYGIKAMIDRAVKNGIIVVAAAGNVGLKNGAGNNVEYPAKFSNVIAVSATNTFNQRISISSTGPEIDFAAPGEAIYSTLPGGLYGAMSGTSMAAPHVAGMIALYMEKYPSASASYIRDLLEWNARDLGVEGKDSWYGEGLVQVDSAVVLNNEIPVVGTAAVDGTVTMDLTPFVEKFTGGYNLYRFNRPFLMKAKETAVVDYGSKGVVSYRIHPIENGVENLKKVVLLDVVVESPYFSDMSNESWFNSYLVYLHSKKVLNGYSGNRLMPNKLVTRAEAVAMLGRALGLDGEKRSTRFSDVPVSSFASGYIEAAAEQGIVNGRLDGSFRPDQPVTRAEMAILLARAYKLPVVEGISFKDVNSSMAGYQEIRNLAGSKITEGYPDGTFKPGLSMDRATYAVFLAKAEMMK
jgi:subtilisin